METAKEGVVEVLGAAGDIATKVVEKKYGTEAATATGHVLGVSGDVMQVGLNVSST